MPPVTRSRGNPVPKAEPYPPKQLVEIAPSVAAPRRKNVIPSRANQPTDSDVVFCEQIINQRPRPHQTSTMQAGEVFQLTRASLQGGPLTFTTNALQYRSAGVPGSHTSSLNFSQLPPHPLGLQRQAVTLRPAGMTGQIILYADSPMSVNVNRQLIPGSPLPAHLNDVTPTSSKTGLKHSLRLVRATTSGWSVVPPPAVPVKADPPKPSPARLRAKKVLPAVPAKTASVKRPKRRSRAMDTSQTRSSTSTESFRSDLAADISSLSGSSNDDSKLTGNDAISSRQSSVSLDEPFGVLPSYTQRQRDAMTSYFRDDQATATRYTALKEWAMARGTKFFHSGNVRLAMKSRVAALLYGNGAGDSVSLSAVEDVRDAVRQVMCDDRVNDFKRKLCAEIINTRDPGYVVSGKTPAAAEVPVPAMASIEGSAGGHAKA